MFNILMMAVAMLITQRAGHRNVDTTAHDAARTADHDAQWNTMLPGNLPPGPLSVLIDAALGSGTAFDDDLRRRAR